MATIALYKDKLNGVGSLISTMVSSTNNLDNQEVRTIFGPNIK